MFQFPGLPPVAMYSQQDTCCARGFPIQKSQTQKVITTLIWAYRKLHLRLSSPLTAKASTVYA